MRRIAILGCSVLLTALTACGTTGTAEPTTPGAGGTTAATAPDAGTGTTDQGSRFMTTADPIGGITVETAPVEDTVPVAVPPTPAPAPLPPAPQPVAPQPKAEPDYGHPPLPPAEWTTPNGR